MALTSQEISQLDSISTVSEAPESVNEVTASTDTVAPVSVAMASGSPGYVAPASPTVYSDSVFPDSVVEAEPVYGIILTAPEPEPPAPQRSSGSLGVSFILSGLFLLFFISALRFRNNIKYASTMFHNLVETRTRQNIFDETVRETSLIVMLNILWCASAGIICYCVYQFFNPDTLEWSRRSLGMLWGMALAVVYTLFMWWAYACVGWVFGDREHASLWIKGFASSQALIAPAFFVIALIGICQPFTGFGVGVAATIFFILGKLAFIWKGYRIFFNQFSSWVLFLCYLCSLEIVPLVLCYRCAIFLGRVL